MKKLGKLIALLLTAAIAVTMFALPVSAAGISSAKTFAEGAVLNWSAPAKKSAVCYLKMTFSDSGKAKFSIGSQKTTAKSKYQILDSKGNKKYSGKISALAGKEITVNKGTYYLKLTLQKGQYVKKLKYTFTGKSSAKKTTGDWLTGYTLTDNEIKQIKKTFRQLTVNYFDEKEINEKLAIDWIYDDNGSIVDPYSNDEFGSYNNGEYVKDPIGKYNFNGFVQDVYKISAADVDKIIYDLFGIKAAHKVSGNYWYYYNNYYYFNLGGVGTASYTEYDSYEKLSDGRFLLKLKRNEFDKWEDDGNGYASPTYSVFTFYSIVSVHKTDGKNYIRIHGVYKNKPSL